MLRRASLIYEPAVEIRIDRVLLRDPRGSFEETISAPIKVTVLTRRFYVSTQDMEFQPPKKNVPRWTLASRFRKFSHAARSRKTFDPPPTRGARLARPSPLINGACFARMHAFSPGSAKLNLNVSIGCEASSSDFRHQPPECRANVHLRFQPFVNCK